MKTQARKINFKPKFRIWSKKYKLFTDDPFWPSNQHTHDEFLVAPNGEVYEMITTDFENYFRCLTNHRKGELVVKYV